MLLNRANFLIVNYFLYPFLILIFCLEVFFQIIFFFDVKSLKKTILFFNPYCDQSYWNYEGVSSYDDKIYKSHSILSLIKRKNQSFYKNNSLKVGDRSKKNIIFYGSSFIGHEIFKKNYDDKINFAIKSYGFDQIYKSYELTKYNFPKETVIIGFLLEDIDRSIFDLRNFPKLKYKKKDINYEITNTPINLKKANSKNLTFYSFNFIKNIIFLINNDFDYKKSKCKIAYKKDLFKFMINNLIDSTKKLDQNLIIVTFNFSEDIISPNWRYDFVKNYLNHKKVMHIDTLEILNKDIFIKQTLPSYYYSQKDFHLNKIGFDLVVKEINKVIKQYK